MAMTGHVPPAVDEPVPAPEPAGPVPAAERIEVVDVVRGFALLGILLVNMAYFAGPIQSAAIEGTRWTGWVDRLAEWAIRFAAEGKFYSLFSLLFGLGQTFQMARAEARGTRFIPLYARRLLVLLLIGLAHALFIWVGDILVLYALLGFVLIMFRRRQPATLLIWTGILLALPVLFLGALAASVEVARAVPEAAARVEASFAAGARESQAQYEAAMEGYRQRSYMAVTLQRARDLAIIYPNMLFAAPSVFAMFLLGVWTGQRGIVRDLPAHVPFLRRAARWGLLIGLPATLVFVVAAEAEHRALPTWEGVLALGAQAIGAPALCIAYAASITLLYQRPSWRSWLAWLAPMGRMALTNYLLQSVIGTTIFYGYGLGLFGQVGPAAGLALAVVIWLAQIPLSAWWLRRFRFGPAEWLWRSLTYRRWQPWRI